MTSKLEKLKYRCKKCGLITEHPKLKHRQANCPKCDKKTTQQLVSLGVPGVVSIGPSKAVKGKVTVTHVPEIVAPEAPKPSLAAPEGEEEWAKAPAGEPVLMVAEDWADLYGMVPEAVSLYLKAPELNFSDETCKIQGERISRFCIRHNIVLPPFLDIVPIVIRLSGDYMKLAGDTAALLKERKKEEEPAAPREKKEVKIPESSVEHVAESPGVPAGFDFDKAIQTPKNSKSPGGS